MHRATRAMRGAHGPGVEREAVRQSLRRLGAGPDVFPIGLGCMGMSDLYGPADERESIATIHAALDAA